MNKKRTNQRSLAIPILLGLLFLCVLALGALYLIGRAVNTPAGRTLKHPPTAATRP